MKLRKGKSSNKIIGAVAVLALFMVALVLVAMTGMVPGTFEDEEDEPDSDLNLVPVSEFDTDGRVTFPTSLSSGTVTLFKKSEVDKEDLTDEEWGNYVDYSNSDAKQGYEEGVDYVEATSVSSDSTDFTDLDAGDYYIYVTDSNIQPYFGEVTMPSEVSKLKVENNNVITLNDKAEIDTAPSYGSENIVWYDSDDNVVGTGTTMDAPTENGTQEFRMVREITVDTGVAYLGSYDASSFNEGDGIEDVDLEIEANGHTYKKDLKDGSSGELADSTSFGEDIVSDSSRNVEIEPVKAQDNIIVTYKFKADVNTLSGSAGDSELNDGEDILTSGIDDISGSDISTATNTFTR